MNSPATHARPSAHPTTPDQLLAASDLPAPIPARIAAIVRATRLWKSEQTDIARELIAHAHDALAAGQSPQETAANLGDPKTIAPLLRRSARRKRPWHWQARHRTLQTIGISLLAMIGVYAILFIRFNTGRPDIKHNYLAELNERNSGYTPDQHASPAFDALRIAWEREEIGFRREESEAAAKRTDNNERYQEWAYSKIPFATRHDTGYDRVLAAYQHVRPLIDAAVEASQRPVLGIIFSDRYEDYFNDDGVYIFNTFPPTEDPAQGRPMIEVLLPWLGHARRSAKLIAFDAIIAAQNDDADRATSSLMAVFHIARLTGNEHTVIASRVALAIQTEAERVLLHILHHPALLTEPHLTKIAHTASASISVARQLDFASERHMFEDVLQRTYTDDGRGDGRLTPQGIRSLSEIVDFYPFDPSSDPLRITHNAAGRLTGPVAMATYGSRAELRDMHDRLISHAEAMLLESPASPAQQKHRVELTKALENLHGSPRYWMAFLMAPALSASVDSAHRAQAHTNATLTTIALHIHHQRTGQWPDTLTELTPHLLPTIPEDPFDPGRPIKYRLIDGVPHIYFIGSDAEDNHATRPTEATEGDVSSLERRYTLPPTDPSTLPPNQGDWIIFPPSPRPSPAGGISGRGPG